MNSQLLDGRYQIVQILGGGSFGQTFLAQDIKRPGHPQCVVKQLRYFSNDPQCLTIASRLFKKEAEVLEKLGQHDQIPTLLADLEENQQFYLVQQFISGHPLTQEILPGQPWTEEQVINLLKEVLEILVFVHQQGVIHRDIKPANLMRRQSDNKIVLIDFGAVKEIGTQIAHGQLNQTVVIGTPGYMPIEQFQGQPQYNSDIYALGMTAIQALLGLAANELSKLQTPHNSNPMEVVWRNRGQVSKPLADIIDKMVKSSYLERYQSAKEVLADLEAISKSSVNLPIPSTAAQPPIAVSPQNNQQKTQQHQPQKKPWFTLALTSALIVIGGLVGVGVLSIYIPQSKAKEFYNQGVEKAKNRDKQGAIENFNQAIQLNPKYAQAYYERADARFHLADYKGSLEDATQAIQLNPNYAEAYKRRCGVEANLKNYQAAIEDCTQAIKINPVYGEAYVNRASTYYAMGEHQKSMEDATQAIRLNSQDTLAYIVRGLVREKLNDLYGANEDYSLVIKLDPNDTRAYINRSNLHRKQGKYQEAIEDANQVIKIKPENSFAYYNRALSYQELNNKPAAIEDFQKTAKLCLEQGNSSCYKNAQDLLAELQKPEVETVAQPKPEAKIATQPTTYTARRQQPKAKSVSQSGFNVQSVPRRSRPIRPERKSPGANTIVQYSSRKPSRKPVPQRESPSVNTAPQYSLPRPSRESDRSQRESRDVQSVPYRRLRTPESNSGESE
ncbi:tetratricopeptide repeat protein [Floridanema aerugineum]|uniref:Tetratricopeptide repeat protein n=1 Tax=Floridaenema aerugineum BLCC-F46 TaxID=3153654 RepID=A0ABV4X7V8_9CYAN